MPAQQNSSPGRGAARTAVVWSALRELLAADSAATAGTAATAATVVDIGGGTGGFAVLAAGLGHPVTVIDPSPDALAALGRRADESGVSELVTGQQGDLGNLLDLVPAGSADVVLCHGVLEVVDDATAALGALAAALRPGGHLSLLVAQRHAAVLARAMAGHFGRARSLLDAVPGGSAGGSSGAGPENDPRRFSAEEITTILDGAGFDTTAVHAVRVFVDLVPSSLVDLEPGAAQALVELEQAVSKRPEYRTLATQLHVVAARRS